MSTILVPLDFSACAMTVLDEAIHFAAAFDCGLSLLHCSEVPRGIPLNALVQRGLGGAPRALSEVLRDDAEAQLASMVARARRGGVPATPSVLFGSVAETILETAAAIDARMIVMGTHGRTGLAHATFGSIAESVIRHAEIPVVTIRARRQRGCAASQCATCDLGRSEVETFADAEELG